MTGLGPGRGDRRRILLAAAIRALATGMGGVLLGIYLAQLGLAPAAIGLVAGAGLAGAAAGALAVTLWGQRWERRGALLGLGLLATAGGVLVALCTHPMALAVAAGLGMVNAMGRDRGPAAALEQAWIPATTSDAGRTRAFAWYAAVQDAGHALGSLAAGLPALLMVWAAAPEELAYRLSMGLYGLLMGAAVVPYLGARARPAEIPPAPRISPESRRVLTRLCLLFGLDGLGGGFLVTALVSYFIFERFGVGAATIGALFFVGRLANILSHFGAAFLARRIGLVNTMVWSHLPASLLLLVMAWTPSFPLAAALFILREALVEMDVPTRQSYVMAVTRPEERVAASGITNLVRLGTWALGPSLAGWMMQGLALATPLVVGAALKMAYDLLLFAAFRRHRPPEELTAAGEARADRGPVPPPPPAPHPPPDR